MHCQQFKFYFSFIIAHTSPLVVFSKSLMLRAPSRVIQLGRLWLSFWLRNRWLADFLKELGLKFRVSQLEGYRNHRLYKTTIINMSIFQVVAPGPGLINMIWIMTLSLRPLNLPQSSNIHQQITNTLTIYGTSSSIYRSSNVVVFQVSLSYHFVLSQS